MGLVTFPQGSPARGPVTPPGGQKSIGQRALLIVLRDFGPKFLGHIGMAGLCVMSALCLRRDVAESAWTAEKTLETDGLPSTKPLAGLSVSGRQSLALWRGRGRAGRGLAWQNLRLVIARVRGHSGHGRRAFLSARLCGPKGLPPAGLRGGGSLGADGASDMRRP
jgi:hypothetical protein